LNLYNKFIEMVFTFIQCLVFAFGLQIHPFYVSVCEIYHNPNTEALEISMKIFIDDLEVAIQKSANPSFKISEGADKNLIENEIEKYLENKFLIEIDSKIPEKKLIGYELDSDAIICYIEIKKIKQISNIKIYNSILTEVYEDQINLTHFQYKDQLKSLKTTKINPEGTITASNW